MDAIEFVKQNGIEKTYKIVDLFPLSTLINIDDYGVSVSDLKQIVNAFEIVKYFGGMANAKYNLTNPSITSTELIDLKTVIELVEKCNES